MRDKTKRGLANVALLLCGAIWGGGFVAMKNALDAIPVNYLLMLRFSLAALCLSFSLFRNRAAITGRLLCRSALVGFLFYLGSVLQGYGLLYTAAGKSALITAFYMVQVPFFSWLLYKKPPEKRMVAAACLMLSGIALLCWTKGEGVNAGDLLTLAGSLFFAAQIIALDRYGGGEDVLVFSCLQLFFSGLSAAVPALLLESFPKQWNAGMLGPLAYCVLCVTLIATLLMNLGVRHASPDYASLFMSTESAFGVVFGVLFLHERMSLRMGAGCLAVLFALVLSQLDTAKLLRRKKVSKKC